MSNTTNEPADLMHCGAENAQVSLHIYAGSPEHLLLAFTKG